MDLLTVNLRKTQLAPMLYPYAGPPPMTLSSCTKMAAKSVQRTREYTSLSKESGMREEIREGASIWQKQGIEDKWRRRRLCLSASEIPGIDDDINGFYSPEAVYMMAKNLREKYAESLAIKLQEASEDVDRCQSNVLTKGRQTFEWGTGQNLPAAAAYNSHMMAIEKTLKKTPRTGSIREMCNLTSELMDVPKITTMRTSFVGKTKDAEGKGKRIAAVREEKVDRKEALKGMMTINSMSKDRERQKMERRAIFSPTMAMRSYVTIVEIIAGRMAECMEESCIHIGGNEKKTSLQNMFVEAYADSGFSIEISGDNSKWNETMHPSMMAIVFDVLTEGLISEDLRDLAFCCFGMFESKIVRMGAGVTLKNKSNGTKYRVKPYEIPTVRDRVNMKTKDLMDIFELCDKEDRVYSQGGMLMGMMNKMSTICGIACGIYMTRAEKSKGIRIRLRQSSDDFIAIVTGATEEEAMWGAQNLRMKARMMGINWSKEKTFGSKLGIGEFTSMFHDGNFVANSSADLPSFKASGINETADIRSGKTAIVQSNRNGQMTKAGAMAAWKCLLHSIRFTYKIFEDGMSETHRAIVIRNEMGNLGCDRMISDGGKDIFSPTTLECEETALRWDNGGMTLEYLYNITNTDNPFSTVDKDEVSIDRENKPRVRMLIEESPNLFSYNIARNRTIQNTSNKILVKVEKVYKAAASSYKDVFLSADIAPPRGGASMADAMKSKLMSRALDLHRRNVITQEEFEAAMKDLSEESERTADVLDSNEYV